MRVLIFCLSLLTSSTQAFAWSTQTSDHAWRSGWGQGWAESQVTHGSGNEIYIACESGSGGDSSITITLAGKTAQPNSEIIFMFDKGSLETFSVGDRGEINTSCNACASGFYLLIDKLKKHNELYVRFNDGRESTFTLKGAAKAIGGCGIKTKETTQPSVSTEWTQVKNTIKQNSSQYIQDCIEKYVKTAQTLGGMSRKEALAGNHIQASCKQDLIELEKCTKMEDKAGLRCYQHIEESKERE